MACAAKALSGERKKTANDDEGEEETEKKKEEKTLSDEFFDFFAPGPKNTSKKFPSADQAVKIDLNNPACFAAGTPVNMADGSRQIIETLKVGDRVLSLDGSSAPVTRTYIRETDHIREIRYRVREETVSNPTDGQGHVIVRRLKTTDEHLFWVQGREWMPARRIRAGDSIVLANGVKAEVIGSERFERKAVVYNFDVEGFKSYFANDALVYQECGGDPDDAVIAWMRRYLKNREEGRQSFNARYLSGFREKNVEVRKEGR